MEINNIKNVSALITYISENSGWSPVTAANVANTLGYRKNGGLESLKELSSNLSDCAKYSADGGFHGFIWYSETTKFFHQNRKDIIKNLEQSAENCGQSIVHFVEGFRMYRCQPIPTYNQICRAIWDKSINEELHDIYNSLSWFCLEDISHIWASYLEINRQLSVSMSA
jgi:hypothetical protein